MNSLSLFIYFASVVSNIGPLLILFGFLMLMAICIVNALRCHHNDYCRSGDEVKLVNFKWLILAPILWMMAAFIPNERTMYMIAASEMGEVVVTNPEMQMIFNSLKTKIMDELQVKDKDDD